MSSTDTASTAPAQRRDRTHFLYIAVIAAVVAGALVGGLFPEVGKALKPLGTGFVNLIKMMISPVIFCTIVLGIGSVRKAAQVGRVGGLALGYFVTMSTFALAIGLVVGNLVKPGDGLASETTYEASEGASGTVDFLLELIPTTLVSPLVGRVGAVDAVRRAARRLRHPGPRGDRLVRAARHRGLPARGVQGAGDDHVGRARSGPSAPSPRSSARPAGTRSAAWRCSWAPST